MLDRKFIVENAERVKQNCVHRGASADVDRLVDLEQHVARLDGDAYRDACRRCATESIVVSSS